MYPRRAALVRGVPSLADSDPKARSALRIQMKRGQIDSITTKGIPHPTEASSGQDLACENGSDPEHRVGFSIKPRLLFPGVLRVPPLKNG